MEVDDPDFMMKAAFEPNKYLAELVAEVLKLRGQVQMLEGMLPPFMWDRYLREKRKADI